MASTTMSHHIGNVWRGCRKHGFMAEGWGFYANHSWGVITNHGVWRHTIGRVSCLARIPIYAFGAVVQGAKTVTKSLVSPATIPVAWITGSQKLHNWTFHGIAKDAIAMANLIDSAIGSILCVLFAPPRGYESLLDAAQATRGMAMRGSYHCGSGPCYGFKEVQKQARRLVEQSDIVKYFPI